MDISDAGFASDASFPSTSAVDVPPIFSSTSLFSLLSVLAILIVAYSLSMRLLPSDSSLNTRVFFVWHLFDALVHFSLEASFLFNCFFVSAPIPAVTRLGETPYFPIPMTPHGVWFLGKPNVLHGSFYGSSPTAKLWQEYAKADRRWGGSDLTVISLELLTVFVMAPCALLVCHHLRDRRTWPKAYFFAVVVATGELYGGFMTFAPEWLTGSPNLDTSNFMYLWVYLFFFNTLWVWFPIWILWEGYARLTDPGRAEAVSAGSVGGRKKRQ